MEKTWWSAKKILSGLSALFLLACMAGGCALKDPQALESLPALPENWSAAVNPAGLLPEKDWWCSFGSSDLEGLLDEALAASPDLAMTVERVIQAETQLRLAGSSLFPSLSLSGGSAWRKSWESGGRGVSAESTSLSLGVSYEADVWGRVAADVRAADALFSAAAFDGEAVRLSLMTGVAAGYFQVLALEKRLEIARNNLEIAGRVLDVVTSRHRHGSATELDLRRQESAVLAQKASLLSLEEQRRQQLSALAILVGRAPQTFRLPSETFGKLTIPEVGAFLPSDLLVRRPDIARAEAQIAASEASVTVARTAFLPTFQLSGSGGLASTTLLSLSNPQSSLGLSAAIVQTLFDGGRRKNQILVAESQLREQVESYRKTILTALKEVEDALNRTDFSARQMALQEDVVEKTSRSLFLAELRYREGADDLLTLLEAQRSLFQAEDQAVQLRLGRLHAALDLYRVLGGGWQRDGGEEYAPL